MLTQRQNRCMRQVAVKMHINIFSSKHPDTTNQGIMGTISVKPSKLEHHVEIEKTPENAAFSGVFGGEGGIRTRVPFPTN